MSVDDELERIRTIEAQLMAPGAPFELVDAHVPGRQAVEWRNRAASLRDLVATSRARTAGDYLVHLDPVHGDRRWSFVEHHDAVATLAAALQGLGVAHGDRVAILAANRPEWVMTFWATVSLGAIAVGMNGWWTADEILFALGDAEPAILVGDGPRLARIDGMALPPCIRHVVDMDADMPGLLATPCSELPDVPIDLDDAAVILYTSGTTGRPKGAIATHRMMTNTVQSIFFHGARIMMAEAAANAGAHAGGADASTTAPAVPKYQLATVVVYPLFHVSGLHAIVVPGIATGMKLVFIDGRFDAGVFLDAVEGERVTSIAAVPTLLRRMLDDPDFAERDLSSVTSVGTGGAPSSPAHLRRIAEAFPSAKVKIGNGYGLTETCGFATSNFGAEVASFPTSVGRALPVVEVRARDEFGTILGAGERGEICFRGVTVMPGYWRRPDATAEAIDADGWFRSGDIGYLDEEGRTFLVDRQADVIIRGGENVYALEVEHRLAEHGAVAEVAVVGAPDEDLGEAVKAFVMTKPGVQATAEELAQWTAMTLAPFKVPSMWEISEEPLPRNPAGKVLKSVLRGTASALFTETQL